MPPTWWLHATHCDMQNAATRSLSFFGGVAQFAAGMWEFRTGHIFGATAITSCAAFWLAFAGPLLLTFGGKAAFDLVSGTALAYFLLGWTIFTGLMTIASLRTNGATALVLLLLFVTFLLLAIGALSP
ncbi:MAG TPA: acetate uptake transporter [Ktedonobacterales bacterium]|nr:acetate uptake transporter [Ktedonobacterales bacterium]